MQKYKYRGLTLALTPLVFSDLAGKKSAGKWVAGRANDQNSGTDPADAMLNRKTSSRILVNTAHRPLSELSIRALPSHAAADRNVRAPLRREFLAACEQFRRLQCRERFASVVLCVHRVSAVSSGVTVSFPAEIPQKI